VKVWPLGLCGLGIVGALFETPREKPYIFILSGNTQGYLSPCGCTKPMVGGIRRRASAIEALTRGGVPIVLENGGLVSGRARQDELKAETLAEALKLMGVTAINFTSHEARLGRGTMLSIARLSGDRLVSGSLAAPPSEIHAYQVEAPFLIGGATTHPDTLASALGNRPVAVDAAVRKLVEEAQSSDLVPILMLEGSRDDARRIATAFPALALIQYQSSGDPPGDLERIGTTILASAGDLGKHLVRLVYDQGRFSTYSVVTLTPEFHDHKSVSAVYSRYLDRVGAEKLLESVPRFDTAPFAGTAKCGSCHAKALKVWKASEHAHALATLEKEGHALDPDCVSCHVVRIDSKQGFRSRALTPQLANVGCESCHGPGQAHALRPKQVKLPKVGQSMCTSCHNGVASPAFDFKAYWPKIAH
jgi:hypothetical protein